MPKHKCEKCGKTFDLKRYLTKHEIRHQKEKKEEEMEPLKCSMCDKVFPRLSHLQRHQLTHFNVRDFACAFCDEKFGQKTHLTRHIARKHPNETGDNSDNTWISCDKCGNLFRTKQEMKVHRKSIHSRHRCQRCSDIIEGVDEKRKHEMKCRNGQNQCGQCGASFGRRADLMAHQTSCMNKVAFVCVECEEYFKQRVQLDRHIKKLHFRSAKCSNCDEISDSPVQNARHSLECLKIVICGYCNLENPDASHISDNHWKRLRRPMSIGKAKKEIESQKKSQKTSDDVPEDSEGPGDSEDVPEGSGDSGERKSDELEDHEERNMFFEDNFTESTSSHLNFASSAFTEDDDNDAQDEEYLTFSISPKASDVTFYLRGKLPDGLKELFPVLEDTSIVLLNSSSASRSRMIVQVPVQIPKNGEKEAEMRKWLENSIVLE